MSTVTNDEERRLTTTSYALLGQLSLRPWSTYELAQQKVRYFRYVWPRAESAIYREVKRLAADGLIKGTRERTGRRSRTVYSITDAGLEELKAWLDTPVSPFAMEFEGMIRLFVARIGTTDQIVAAVEQVQEDARQMLDFGGEVKLEYLEGRGALQDQVYIRAHAIDFFISLLNMVEDWTTRTLDEMQEWDSRSLEERNERALRILAAVPAPTPDKPTGETPIAPQTQTRRRRRTA
ncbi:MAG: PadR family transcriptional regulator [Actinomycetota bacterium]